MNPENAKHISTKEALYIPDRNSIEHSNLYRFQNHLASMKLADFPDLAAESDPRIRYRAFHKWSIDQAEIFWKELAEYVKTDWIKKPEAVIEKGHKFKDTKWFPGGQTNFAMGFLKDRSEKPAIIFRKENGQTRTLSRSDLYIQVYRYQQALKKLGVKKGDRIAAVLPQCPESVIGMLATTSLGAIWTSASPDFGVKGILDRFAQISPRILLVCNGYLFKGKEISTGEKFAEVRKALGNIDTLIIDFLGDSDEIEILQQNGSSEIQNNDIMPEVSSSQDIEIEFTPISFQDPVYIMYSSGTTGLPKCIVQGPGVLLNHRKELLLHTDIRPGDKIFYFTTCGWMMWNWVTSALACDAVLCQFDGNPFYPDSNTLWNFVESEKIKIFGTSAKYLTVLEQENYSPQHLALESLQTLLSTGSPLPATTFQYVYTNIKRNLLLSSISGGTDLNGCFALGNPTLPVYSGEIQCIGSGMDVKIYDENASSLIAEQGELVCTSPFPSMPLFFWNDDASGSKYHNAYFDVFDNVWCHGDFAEITDRGGLIMYGRSDATLNPGGVRIGTADIYSVVETFPEITDSVIVGQNYNNDVRIVLFVKMVTNCKLDDDLKKNIKNKIRQDISPRHMPAIILEVPDIPYTVNMKKVELAVKNIIEGKEIKNLSALANPECLEHFKDHAELQ